MAPAKLTRWCWALAAAALVFGARLHEIHLYGGDVAFKDQWKVEAHDLLAPWLDGRLRPADFFLPHFEHVPMWTRALGWLQVVATNRWDPQVQTTVNALLYAGLIAIWVRWLAARLRPAELAATSLLWVVIGSLPHAWENITWGFQSQFPLALLCLFLHVRGAFEEPAGRAPWWGAMLAGVAGLFTLAGMWLAPLAVGVVAWWTGLRGPRRWAPLLVATSGLVMTLALRPAGGATPTDLGPRTAWEFLYALLDQLGWPAAWPGAVALVNLPLVLLALQMRNRADAPAFDRITLALGLWAAGQALALAIGRGAGYYGYVSRYGDLLALLPIANALALVRLLPAFRRGRWVAAVFAAGWSVAILVGVFQLSTGGHARYFHEHADEWARQRHAALEAYLSRQDRTLLERPETTAILYVRPDTVTTLLDHPGFRSLLPHAVWAENPPDPVGTTVRILQAHAWWFGVAAPALLVAGLVSGTRAAPSLLPTFAWQPETVLPWLCFPTAVIAGALALSWPDPLTLDQEERWERFFHPPGGVGPLEVHLERGTPELPDQHFFGAVPLSPPGVRFQFSGTNPGTLEFTGTLSSRPFPITKRWLVVPYSGAPVAHGNGLRLRIEEPGGPPILEVACPGPNREDIGYWRADVHEYVGKQARLMLYDGRGDTLAWVGAAPPIATDDPWLARKMAAAFAWEQTAALHHALVRLALVSLLLGIVGLKYLRPPGDCVSE